MANTDASAHVEALESEYTITERGLAELNKRLRALRSARTWLALEAGATGGRSPLAAELLELLDRPCTPRTPRPKPSDAALEWLALVALHSRSSSQRAEWAGLLLEELGA